MRSIFPETVKPPRSRPRCSSGAERSEPNATSKRFGTSGEGDSASARTSCSRSRMRPTSSSRRSSSGRSDRTWVLSASPRHSRRSSSARSSVSGWTRSAPSAFGRPLKNAFSAWWATLPRRSASTCASIVRGETTRSKSQIEEQSAKRSRSVTEKLVFARNSSRTTGSVRRVGRSKAASARSRRRSQPFARASAFAWSGSAAASEARARRRPRSLGADSSVHLSAARGRRPGHRSTSAESHRLVLEERHDLLSRALAAEAPPLIELVGQGHDLRLRAKVELGALGRRWRLEGVRGLDQRARRLAQRGDRIPGGAQCAELRQGLGPELLDLLFDPRRRPDTAAAKPPFEKVGVPARKAGIGRAQEGEQVAPLAVEPRVTEQAEQRLAERRQSEPQPALERVRHAVRREGRVERSAPAVEGRADDRDLLGRGPLAQQFEHLLGDELQRAAQARAFEEADRAVERRRRCGLAEQAPLEIGRGHV